MDEENRSIDNVTVTENGIEKWECPECDWVSEDAPHDSNYNMRCESCGYILDDELSEIIDDLDEMMENNE